MKNLFVILFSFLSFSIIAQVDMVEEKSKSDKKETPLSKAEKDLKGYVKTFLTNRDVDARQEAATKFVEGFQTALELPQSFDYKFDSLSNVLHIYPPDSTFRILTWELYVDKDEYKYFGIIQHRGDSKKGIAPKVILLDDFSGRMRKIEDKIYNAQNWYGALYYNIKPFKTKEGIKYALFGLDSYEFFEKRKILEILSFDEEREPIFGAPVIEYTIKQNNVPPREMVFNRFMIQYSSEAAASINFNTDEDMILFDHLIPMNANFPGVEYVMVPDGSYEGFKLKKGVWTYVEKVYDHKYEIDEFPVPEPVLNKSDKKDIFGRPRK